MLRLNARRLGLAQPAVLLSVVVLLVALAVPALAHADTVTVRIEAKSGVLVPRAQFTLPTNAVSPVGAAAGQTCPGNSVVGAVQAATSGNWNGTWTDDSGWSIDRVMSATALPSDGRKWLVFVNGVLSNDPPCQRLLANDTTVTLYPACLTATTNCFTGGLLDITGPATIGPGAPLGMQVFETTVTLDAQGNGTSQRAPSFGATVTGPDGSAPTDAYYGTGIATIVINEKGPALVYATRQNRVPDRTTVCVTDGNDGYCGTQQPDPVPFDPYAFCQTTGNDGYCNSPDHVAPLGRITSPRDATTFTPSGSPQTLKGTVDFDPSLTDHVNLRLMRQRTVTVTKYKKRKAWVKKRVDGKVVRKRVTRRKSYKVKQKACYGWSDKAASWNRLKKCDAATAGQFRADGAEVWSYSFLQKLPTGVYTLDALAEDGASNVDTTREQGRNRVTFTVR